MAQRGSLGAGICSARRARRNWARCGLTHDRREEIHGQMVADSEPDEKSSNARKGPGRAVVVSPSSWLAEAGGWEEPQRHLRHELRQLEHRRRCLDQDLRANKRRCLGREVGVTDGRLGRGSVDDRDA